MKKEERNAINIDYFKPDFNRYPGRAPFKQDTGLTFAAILFIMINKSPSLSPPEGGEGGGMTLSRSLKDTSLSGQQKKRSSPRCLP